MVETMEVMETTGAVLLETDATCFGMATIRDLKPAGRMVSTVDIRPDTRQVIRLAMKLDSRHAGTAEEPVVSLFSDV